MAKLRVSKKAIMEEVAQRTAYASEKSGALDDRMWTIDDDGDVLDRFWDEARTEACQGLMRIVSKEGMAGVLVPVLGAEADSDIYEMELNLSASFDATQLTSMQIDLFGYFVQAIVGRWFAFASRTEGGAYLAEARETLDRIRRKAFYKVKPTRPTYTD